MLGGCRLYYSRFFFFSIPCVSAHPPTEHLYIIPEGKRKKANRRYRRKTYIYKCINSKYQAIPTPSPKEKLHKNAKNSCFFIYSNGILYPAFGVLD